MKALPLLFGLVSPAAFAVPIDSIDFDWQTELVVRAIDGSNPDQEFLSWMMPFASAAGTENRSITLQHADMIGIASVITDVVYRVETDSIFDLALQRTTSVSASMGAVTPSGSSIIAMTSNSSAPRMAFRVLESSMYTGNMLLYQGSTLIGNAPGTILDPGWYVARGLPGHVLNQVQRVEVVDPWMSSSLTTSRLHTFSVVSVPEPTGLVLLGAGLVINGFARWRTRAQRNTLN